MLRRVLNRAAAGFDRMVAKTVLTRSKTSRAKSRAESLGPDERAAALEAIRESYDRPEHYADPDTFFVPPMPAHPRTTHVRDIDGPSGRGEVLDLAWGSAFVPYEERIAARYLEHERNRTAWARLLLHRDRPRPAAVLVHGYRSGQLALEERVLPARWFFDRGLDVALFVLPFHGLRGERGRPRFPSSDPRFTNEGFRQAMFDLRALLRWFDAHGAPSAGALGMSLGGYTVALLSTIEPLAFVVPFIPLASVADFARADDRFVGTAEQKAQQHAALEAAHRVVSPLARPSLVAPDRALVLAAEGDRITPVSHARRLAAHLGAELETFTGGHLLQLGRSEALRAVGRLLERAGLSERRLDRVARS